MYDLNILLIVLTTQRDGFDKVNQEKANILGLLLSAGNESQDFYNHPLSTHCTCASLIIDKINRNQAFTFSLF